MPQPSSVIRAAARRVVAQQPMWEASTVAAQLSLEQASADAVVAHLRTGSQVVGVWVDDRWLYPMFQFDPAGARVFPVVERINRHLDAANDPYGVASWWITPTARLGGLAPQDLLGVDREHDLLTLAGVPLAP